MATQLKKIVAPSGGDYTSLEACLNANQQDLVAADKYFDVEISGSWSSTDGTEIYMNSGWYTTDATRYLNIYAVGTSRYEGNIAKPGIYKRIYLSSYNISYMTIDGLSFISPDYKGLSLNNMNDGQTTIKNCYCESGEDGSVALDIYIGIFTTHTIYLLNCVAITQSNYSSGAVEAISAYHAGDGGNIYIYNCIGIAINDNPGHDNQGIWARGYSRYVYLKNCYAHSYNSGNAYVFVGYTNMVTCASSDSTGTSGLRTIAYSTSSGSRFTNLTSGTEDFHIGYSSSLNRVGTNIAATFTYDIDGMWRGTTWSIGIDQRYSFSVKSSGGDYTTLEACVNANEGSLASKGFMNIEIDGTWGSPDTTRTIIENYTTDAVNRINIYTVGSSRHSGTWSDTCYRHTCSSNYGTILVNDFNSSCVTLDGLQLYGYSTPSYGGGMGCQFYVGGNHVILKNNLAKKCGSYGLYVVWAAHCEIYNNIIYQVQYSACGIVCYPGDDTSDETYFIYNNTVHSNDDDNWDVYCVVFEPYENNPVYKVTYYIHNNIAVANNAFPAGHGAGFSYWSWPDGTTTDHHEAHISNNFLSDNSLDGYGRNYSNQSVDQFVSRTLDSENFYLKAGSTAIGQSTKVSELFTTDITGSVRGGAWSLGAHQYDENRDYTMQTLVALPSNDTDLSYAFVSSEYNDVALDDNIYVVASGQGVAYQEFLFKDQASFNNEIGVEWVGNTNVDPASYPVYLQIYNRDSGLWETLDSDNTSSIGVDFPISGYISTNIDHYFDVNKWVSCRVYQEIPSSSSSSSSSTSSSSSSSSSSRSSSSSSSSSSRSSSSSSSSSKSSSSSSSSSCRSSSSSSSSSSRSSSSSSSSSSRSSSSSSSSRSSSSSSSSSSRSSSSSSSSSSRSSSSSSSSSSRSSSSSSSSSCRSSSSSSSSSSRSSSSSSSSSSMSSSSSSSSSSRSSSSSSSSSSRSSSSSSSSSRSSSSSSSSSCRSSSSSSSSSSRSSSSSSSSSRFSSSSSSSSCRSSSSSSSSSCRSSSSSSSSSCRSSSSSSSASPVCWVAAEVFGGWENENTYAARYYIKNIGPKWFHRFYVNNGERIAAFIHNKPILKAILKPMFEYFVRKAAGKLDKGDGVYASSS